MHKYLCKDEKNVYLPEFDSCGIYRLIHNMYCDSNVAT